MKQLTIIATAILFITSAFGQSKEMERFTVKGTAKLIATWIGKTPNDASGTLTSGDKIQIQARQNGVTVFTIHNNVGKNLVQARGEDIKDEIIKVYEYDFDSDGQKEIMAIYSSEFSVTTVEVFKYSGGLSERVGNFNAQFDIVLDKNTIYLPFGSQGLGNEYLFNSDSFYELVYHDPNKTDK